MSSIEKLIGDLTIAINSLTIALNQRAGGAGAPIVQQAPTPVAPVQPQFAAPAAAMPAPPSFAPPAQPQFAAPAAPQVPFADGAGLIAYVMDAYKTMGAQKGAQIQNVLNSIGVQNINDVKPEQYGAVFQGVEALKRG